MVDEGGTPESEFGVGVVLEPDWGPFPGRSTLIPGVELRLKQKRAVLGIRVPVERMTRYFERVLYTRFHISNIADGGSSGHEALRVVNGDADRDLCWEIITVLYERLGDDRTDVSAPGVVSACTSSIALMQSVLMRQAGPIERASEPGIAEVLRHFDLVVHEIYLLGNEVLEQLDASNQVSRSDGDLRADLAGASSLASRERFVLLGAGASAFGGVPDGRALHRHLMSVDARLPIYNAIGTILATNDSEFGDVERVFGILDAMSGLGVEKEASIASDLWKVLLLRPYNDEELDVDESSLALRAAFDVVLEIWNREDGARVAAEVEMILTFLKRLLWFPESVDGIEDRFSYLTPLVLAQTGGSIATLNYDNTLHIASRGLVEFPTTQTRVEVAEETEDKVRLLHLHGCLSWQRIRRDDDVIFGGDPYDSSDDYVPAIIFGAGNKLRHYGPYLEILREFNTCLARCDELHVIGYSFRDPHVNSLLARWAKDADQRSRERVLHVCLRPGGSKLNPAVDNWKSLQKLTVKPHKLDVAQYIELFFDAGC